MALLECKNISLAYEGKTIVSELNFKVEKGDYLCIVGENGSGKTTLMKTLVGLKTPSDGKIIFGDGLSQKNIGYLPQQSGFQKDFPATVREIVMSGFLGKCGLRPYYTKEEKKKASENMEKLSVTDLAGACYRELSGGQQQRVLLARALCAAGDMLLLDEPVAGLDPKVSVEMYSLIEKLNKEEKITVIMISHDIYSAIKYSSHILHIGHTPLFFGKTEDYTASDVGRVFVDFSKKEEDTNE
ncbi:MAG: ABC transporter ATP-binding protein [Ruminococcaceae bacterium]|nr:ABC transporter ATP-binding protein [Oscillospiraceae bacterium]